MSEVFINLTENEALFDLFKLLLHIMYYIAKIYLIKTAKKYILIVSQF